MLLSHFDFELPPEQMTTGRFDADLRAEGYLSLREIAEGLATQGVTDRAEVVRALGPADDDAPSASGAG